jgi:hypothetical protein
MARMLKLKKWHVRLPAPRNRVVFVAPDADASGCCLISGNEMMAGP